MGKPSAKSAAPPRGKPGDFEEIVPPNLLVKKLGPGRGVDPDLLIEAETAVYALQAKFEKRFMTEMNALQDTLNEMKLNNDFDIQHVSNTVRELTGEGGTYGYPLVSRFGRSLCVFMDDMTVLDPEQVGLIDAHLDAMRAVVGGKVRGDGGKMGQQLVHELEMVTSRMSISLP